jgi:hypothetical protein
MIRLLFLALFAMVVGVVIFEGTRFYSYYDDLSGARESLERARVALEASGPENEAALSAVRTELQAAQSRLERARDGIRGDPALRAAQSIGAADTQIDALDDLILTTSILTDTGVQAADTLQAFERLRNDGLQPRDGVELKARLVGVRERFDDALLSRGRIQSSGLILPLAQATREVDGMIVLIDNLLTEYEALVA